ncbi:PIN domain-containing protein [bacterium]|nr:PIN domain-containing protein [bacterium]
MTLSSCDTNILLHALNIDSPYHAKAANFLKGQAKNRAFRVCELVLLELYILLRNPAVLTEPLDAPAAANVCKCLRSNSNWGVLDYPGPLALIMERLWDVAGAPSFARRRIFDARLAMTLLHYGVTEFYTQNAKDFEGFGFQWVRDPLGQPA